MNAPKKSPHPIVLCVDYQPAREGGLGTHYVVVSIATLEPDDIDNRAPFFSRWRDQGIRHREEIGGLYVRDLVWRSYRRNKQESHDSPRALYPVTAGEGTFERVYVDWRNVDAIKKTLATLEKRAKTASAKFGHAASFAESVLRLADIVGASKIAIEYALLTEATGRKHPQYETEHRTRIFDRPGDAQSDLAAIGNVDIAPRCTKCSVVVDEGRTTCREHTDPLVDEAHEVQA